MYVVMIVYVDDIGLTEDNDQETSHAKAFLQITFCDQKFWLVKVPHSENVLSYPRGNMFLTYCKKQAY